jgi:hypothetical protein
MEVFVVVNIFEFFPVKNKEGNLSEFMQYEKKISDYFFFFFANKYG